MSRSEDSRTARVISTRTGASYQNCLSLASALRHVLRESDLSTLWEAVRLSPLGHELGDVAVETHSETHPKSPTEDALVGANLSLQPAPLDPEPRSWVVGLEPDGHIVSLWLESVLVRAASSGVSEVIFGLHRSQAGDELASRR